MLFRFFCGALLMLAMNAGSGAAHAQSHPTLSTAIMDANWNDSNWFYQNSSIDQNIATLTPLAQNNVVMAQWFLADALARQGRDAEATVWLYSASLATRMDSALCRQKDAETIEYRFLHTFANQFSRLRANEVNRSNALNSAIRFHSTRLQASNQSDWVCRLVVHETKRAPSKKPRPIKIPVAKSETWMETRQRVFEEYKKQTGMDFSKTPDLIPITRPTQSR